MTWTRELGDSLKVLNYGAQLRSRIEAALSTTEHERESLMGVIWRLVFPNTQIESSNRLAFPACPSMPNLIVDHEHLEEERATVVTVRPLLQDRFEQGYTRRSYMSFLRGKFQQECSTEYDFYVSLGKQVMETVSSPECACECGKRVGRSWHRCGKCEQAVFAGFCIHPQSPGYDEVNNYGWCHKCMRLHSPASSSSSSESRSSLTLSSLPSTDDGGGDISRSQCPVCDKPLYIMAAMVTFCRGCKLTAHTHCANVFNEAGHCKCFNFYSRESAGSWYPTNVRW